MEDRTVFLTGGLGFIGGALLRRLVDHNHVVVFDNAWRQSPDAAALTEHPHVTLVEGDILDPGALTRAMAGCDVVVHLAAIAGVSSYYKLPLRTMEVNLIGTHNVLNAAHALGPLRRFVYFSTSEIFGPLTWRAGRDTPTRQGHPEDRRWTYAISKLAAEKLVQSHHWQHGLPAVILRPFNIYGPGQIGEGAIQRFATRALRGDALEVTGDGLQIRSWCFIDDMIDAIELVLNHDPAVGRAYNIGNPRSTITILNLAERIRDLTGSASAIVFVPHVGVDIDLRVPDITQAREDLGFEPKVGLDDGLRRAVDWYAGVSLPATESH
jgi:nucleoside-diphosphate-sugar epimerase